MGTCWKRNVVELNSGMLHFWHIFETELVQEFDLVSTAVYWNMNFMDQELGGAETCWNKNSVEHEVSTRRAFVCLTEEFVIVGMLNLVSLPTLQCSLPVGLREIEKTGESAFEGTPSRSGTQPKKFAGAWISGG